MDKALMVSGLGGLVVCMLGIGYSAVKYAPSQEYVAPIVQTATSTVEVDMLEKRISEAQEAAKSEIEAEADRMREEAVKQGLLEIEKEVRKAYRLELEAIEETLEAETQAY